MIEVAGAAAIIGVLVAALIPALSQSRETGRLAICLSNMHTLGVAFGNYAQDNTGFLPVGRYQSWTGITAGQPVTDPVVVREWMRLYYPYILTGTLNESELTNPYASPDMVTLRDSTSVFDCPSTSARVGHFHPASGYQTMPKRFDYLVFAQRIDPAKTPLHTKLDSLPTNSFLLMDARATDPVYSWGNNGDPNNDNYFMWQLMFNPSNLTTPHLASVDGAQGYRPGFHHANGCATLFPGGNAMRLARTDVQPGYISGNYTTRTKLP